MEGLNIIFCEIKELVGTNASGSINLARAPSLIRLPCQPQEALNFLVVKKWQLMSLASCQPRYSAALRIGSAGATESRWQVATENP